MKTFNKFSANKTIFITFKNSEDSDKFNDFFPESLAGYFSLLFTFFLSKYILCCCFKDSYKSKLRKRLRYRCTRTEEPSDIIWENLEYSTLERVKRTFFVYIICFIIIGGCFVILYFVNTIQNSLSKKASIYVKYGYSLGFSIINFIINKLLQYVLEYLTKIEKQASMSAFYLSYSYKLLICSFLNNAIVPIVVFYATSENWNNKGKILTQKF